MCSNEAKRGGCEDAGRKRIGKRRSALCVGVIALASAALSALPRAWPIRAES